VGLEAERGRGFQIDRQGEFDRNFHGNVSASFSDQRRAMSTKPAHRRQGHRSQILPAFVDSRQLVFLREQREKLPIGVEKRAGENVDRLAMRVGDALEGVSIVALATVTAMLVGGLSARLPWRGGDGRGLRGHGADKEADNAILHAISCFPIFRI
jgi:hypothetical protein